MKLQKIKKAMKGKTIIIFTDDGGFQWLSDGTAAYLMDRELDLTKGNVLAILDIEEEQRDSYSVREVYAPTWLDQCPQELYDKQLHPLASVSWMGELITIMRTDEGEAVMVPQRQIAPADGRQPLVFFLRRSVNPETGEVLQPMVCCFEDMLCGAIICPMHPETAAEIWALLRRSCAEGLRYCMEEKKEEEEPDV